MTRSLLPSPRSAICTYLCFCRPLTRILWVVRGFFSGFRGFVTKVPTVLPSRRRPTLSSRSVGCSTVTGGRRTTTTRGPGAGGDGTGTSHRGGRLCRSTHVRAAPVCDRVRDREQPKNRTYHTHTRAHNVKCRTCPVCRVETSQEPTGLHDPTA